MVVLVVATLTQHQLNHGQGVTEVRQYVAGVWEEYWNIAIILGRLGPIDGEGRENRCMCA